MFGVVIKSSPTYALPPLNLCSGLNSERYSWNKVISLFGSGSPAKTSFIDSFGLSNNSQFAIANWFDDLHHQQ